MKRKYIAKTYLRDVPKYEIKMYLDEEDNYIVVKKLIQVDIPFVIGNNVTVMDNNYYVFEVVPKNENYAMRLFIDDKGNALEYYFDICKNNNLDSNTNTPYYDDLYLDITYMNGNINILDKDELDEALRINDITEDDYKLVMVIKEKLLKEITNKENKLMQIDYHKYLF